MSRKVSEHSATDIIGFITVKFSQPPPNPPNFFQVSNMYSEPTQQMGELERRTAEEVEERGQIDTDEYHPAG